jgi:hypothetical protein
MRALLCASFLLPACAIAGLDDLGSSTSEVKLPNPIQSGDLAGALDKPTIRALQTWVDDATFDQKWTAMLATPIDFLGGADSAFHADLANVNLPGKETLCHGDPKLDNFGWTLVDGAGVFSDNDFDDAGFCPVAADVLRYLVATDLWFGDPTLDQTALDAYIATIADPNAATAIDMATEPVWDDLRAKDLAKDTSGDTIVLGGEVQAATQSEIDAVVALFADDWRFPPLVLDVTRDVRVDGGSADMRRFWALTDDGYGTRTIIELKEMGPPGVEFGPHTQTLDGADRADVLKAYWWSSTTDDFDHFQVDFLGSEFLVRDRMTRANPKPNKMTAAQISNMVAAEASLLAVRHRKAWGHTNPNKLESWLSQSAATLTARWRAAYTAAGGH